MNYSIFINEFKIENWNNFLLVCDEFAEVGLDINSDKFLFDIPKDVHRLKPDGLHTTTNPLGQTWNAAWKDFFMKNPDFSKGDVLD